MKFVYLLAFSFIYIVPSFAQDMTRYVSQTFGSPDGDGLSWATASDDLQAMIDDVPENGFIHLEQGTYKPKANPSGCIGCASSRDFAFYTDKSIKIIGGFFYGGIKPYHHPQNTVISGDIGIAGDPSDNCYHVIISKRNILLQNLTVSNGTANSGGSVLIDEDEFFRNNGGGISCLSPSSVKLNYVMFFNNFAHDKGGAIYGKNIHLAMKQCVVRNNTAGNGGGLYLSNTSFQDALIEKSVFANNTANLGGAMFVNDPPLPERFIEAYEDFFFRINCCTYFGNTASSGSVLWVPNPISAKMIFANSIVYGNINTIYNFGDTFLPGLNSIIQGGYASGFEPLRTETPDFINPIDLDGADNLFFTEDDGLVPQMTSKGAATNMGAYHWNTTLCLTSTILYVDINNPTPGDGSTWSTALNDLNVALRFARRCDHISEIRVAQGNYIPDQYTWFSPKFDFELDYGRLIATPHESGERFPSSTFILRPGLDLIGGFPTGGGLRNREVNETILNGNYRRNVVTIHEINLNSSDFTVLDGFTIKNGRALMNRRARTPGFLSSGAGIKIYSNAVIINNNLIKENSALESSAIEVYSDGFRTSKNVTISNNIFTDNTTSPSTYFLFEPEGTLITMIADSCTIQGNTITNNMLGPNSILLEVKGSDHNITGNNIHNNPSQPIILKSFRSTCSNNEIINNLGHGIIIFGDSCQVLNNNIDGNLQHGIFVENEVITYPSVVRDYSSVVIPGMIIQNNFYAKIYNNTIKSNQGDGIFVKGKSDADVYSNTIISNLGRGVVGASNIRNNIINNQTQAILSDSASIHHNIVIENLNGIKVFKGDIYNNYIVDNDDALTIGLGNVYNNVMVNNNNGVLSGGITVHNDNTSNNESNELHITNNTFYANVATDPNGGGGIFISKFKGDTIEILNNIFYQNAISVLTNVAGADFRYNKSEVDYPPVFKNNMMQLSAGMYTSVGNNNLEIGSVDNIFNAIPSFNAITDLDGPDDVYMTRDDGLALADLSSGIDAGLSLYILDKTSTDISGLPRILGLNTDIGAYEKINCLALDTIYVNKNHVHTTGGSGWRSAIQDLNVALWLAHECSNLAVINVSADEYKPNAKPYEMQPSSNGIEISTTDERDKTFHIRTGVELYGGFLIQGDTARRDPTKFRTLLNGNIGDTSVYHTILLSYNTDYWTDPLDTTIIEGFDIKGGNANGLLNQKISVNGNDIYKANGGGISIFGGTNKISYCTIEDCKATIGGAIYSNTDSTTVTKTLIKQNIAEIASGMASINGKGTFFSNTFHENQAKKTAGLLIENGSCLVINNVFNDNLDTLESGSITLVAGSNKLINNTFYNNKSENAGALYIAEGNHQISNNIFHRNKKDGLFNAVGSDYLHTNEALTVTFTHNALQLATPANYNVGNQNNLGTSMDNLFNVNPVFYDSIDIIGFDGKFGTFDDGLRLLVGSPMVNVGNNSALPTQIMYDIYGSPRVQKGIVDLGAYEGPNVRCPVGLFDTLFVDMSVPVSGNGSKWTQAFKTLDEAIFITHMCPYIKYICVAEGTYYPSTKPYNMQSYLQGIETETLDNRDVTFHIRDGVVLLGGYAAGGTPRNPSSYSTVLEGSISGGTENAYHTCLMASSKHWFINNDTTILDGVTIQKAYANSKPTILDINENPIKGSYGGGLYMVNGHHAVRNSKFELNYADEFGGGLYCNDSKSVTLTKNTFSENTSSLGGAIYIRKCEQFNMGYNSFSFNIASDKGGALYIDSTDNILHHNTVKFNNAKFGAGFYIKNDFLIEDCDFAGNNTIVNGKGAAIFMTDASGVIDRCIFDSNVTDLHGGGLYSLLCDSVFLWNSVFYGNQATNAASLGGAVYNDKNDYFEQVNCTTHANTADEGSTIYTLSNNPVLKNNIFFDDSPISTVTGSITLTHSIVKGGHPSCVSCPGSLGDTNPLFINVSDLDGIDDVYRTEDDGLNVLLASPALDNGALYRSLSHDITYSLRDWGHRDIGAYEYFSCPSYDTLFVDKELDGGKGLAWNSAIKEVSVALYVAHTCPNINEINVAQGIYFPNYKPFDMTIDQDGHELYTASDLDKTFHVRPGLNMYGGFKSGGNIRDTDIFSSILNGDIADGLADARHVVLIGPDTELWTGLQKVTLDGFHIQDGRAISNGSLVVNGKPVRYNIGAGIYANNAVSTNINDNIIKNNVGTGIFMTGGENILTNNTITLNEGNDGGGIYLTQGFNTLTNNLISENTASQGGGIFLLQDSTILTENNIFQNEATNYWGGGIFTLDANVALYNNEVTGNIAKMGGGAFIQNGQFAIDSNQIVHNKALTFGGGGIHIENSMGHFYKNTLLGNVSNMQSGGGLSIQGGKIRVESNLFSKNKAFFTGGGMSTGTTDLYAVNNVFFKDTAYYGSALQTYFGFNEIHNNTFFKNEGTMRGGAFASAYAANDLINNVFYQNTKAGSHTIGADIYNDETNESFNVFDNNAMQFAENDYNSANQNVLHVSQYNLFSSDPIFVNETDVLGPDLTFGTNDDGLRLDVASPCINVGNKNLVPDSIALDAKHAPRIMNFQIDLGAYENFRDPCISNVLYVDTNRVAGKIGNNWANAFNTLTEALFVAHQCPDVDSILITEGTYYPDSKPFQMIADMTGHEIMTDDIRDLTFHIRQGLTVIGGYPGGGDDSPSSAYKTILSGRKEFSIHASYHTVLMDTSSFWTAENKQSSLQYCVVNDGVGADQMSADSIWLNSAWVHNTKGSAIYNQGAKTLIKYNTIRNNEALQGAGIYVAPASQVVAQGNDISQNLALVSGGAIFSEQAVVELLNNVILNNLSSNQNLRGLIALGTILKLLGGNTLDSLECNGGTLDVQGLNIIK